jgi:hypothetical protein
MKISANEVRIDAHIGQYKVIIASLKSEVQELKMKLRRESRMPHFLFFLF